VGGKWLPEETPLREDGRWTMNSDIQRYSKIFTKKKELDFGFFPVGYLVWILTMYNIEHSPGLFLLILIPVR
jgi:hypothetical protein